MSETRKNKTGNRKFSKAEEQEIASLFKVIFSAKELSIKYNCSIPTIRNILKRIKNNERQYR
jgi:Mor family transcriptional regulator